MKRRDQWICIGILAAACVGLVVHALQYAFISDDAYISFRYAYNLAYHNELTFNLGDRVEGYTNFLWTVTLGLLLKAGLRPDAMARILGAGFGVLVIVLSYAFTRLYRGGRATGWDTLGSLMLAGTAGFAVWCSGGLETQMFTALMLGGMTLYLAEHAGRVRWRLSGVVFALSAMARPEGLLIFGLTGLHWLLVNLSQERRLLPTRAELAWIAGFLIPFGLFFYFRYSYYGYPFPNTYYIKAGGGASASATKWGLPYLWDFIWDNKLFVLLALLPAFRPRSSWLTPRDGSRLAHGPARRSVDTSSPPGIRPGFVWSYVALVGLTYAAYVTQVGGDFMAMGRFFVPVVPLVALFAQEGLRELVDRPATAPDDWSPVRFATVALLLIGLLIYNSVGTYRQNQKQTYHRWGLDTIAYLDKFAADRIKVGNWLRRNLPKQTYLAVGGAGAIVYASRMKALDTFGLNDRWIAHNTPRTGDRPGHTKSAPEHYILKERPDLLCHQAKHQDWPYRPSGGDPYWRSRGYGWVCIDPPGLRPRYYCCLKRLDKELGPFPAERGGR